MTVEITQDLGTTSQVVFDQEWSTAFTTLIEVNK